MKIVRQTRSTLARMLAAALLASGSACDDGLPVPPEEFQPVGTWTATTFIATFDGRVHDVLAEGGAVSVTLHENGTIGGVYVWPAIEGTESYELGLEGEWVKQGFSKVFITHQEGPFLQYVPFTGGGNQMAGEGSADGVIVNIVLRRT